MKNIFKIALGLFAMFTVASANIASADAVTNSVVGVQGYDLVSYHQDGGPVRGTGNFISYHDGVTYLFSSLENRDTFAKAPAKYLPAYGGYCAYGVKFGKKFTADPEAWKLVKGTLYLNLDEKVQSLWIKDIPTHIKEADVEWTSIEGTNASEL